MVNAKKANLALRVGLSIAGAVGLASITGRTEEEATAGRFLGALVTASPDTTLREKAWGYAIKEGSQAQLDSINAGKMRIDVNVNVYGSESVRNPLENRHIIIHDDTGNWVRGRYVREDDKLVYIYQKGSSGIMGFPKNRIKYFEIEKKE